MWYIHTTDYALLVKMNEVLIHTTKWTNFENITLSEKKATKTTNFMTPFMWNNQNRTLFKAGDIGRKWEVIANGYKVSLWGDENALKLIIVMICTTLIILKTTEEFTLNEWIVCMWIIAQRMLPKKKKLTSWGFVTSFFHLLFSLLSSLEIDDPTSSLLTWNKKFPTSFKVVCCRFHWESVSKGTYITYKQCNVLMT